MWPFRKKQPKADSSVPFQEFLRTYVPAAPRAIENPLPVETVCPVCFTQFPVGTMPADWPMCPDCSSEGMDLGVEPLEAFLASKTLEDLDEIGRCVRGYENGGTSQGRKSFLKRLVMLEQIREAAHGVPAKQGVFRAR